jgi:hypothetical protein
MTLNEIHLAPTKSNIEVAKVDNQCPAGSTASNDKCIKNTD